MISTPYRLNQEYNNRKRRINMYITIHSDAPFFCLRKFLLQIDTNCVKKKWAIAIVFYAIPENYVAVGG